MRLNEFPLLESDVYIVKLESPVAGAIAWKTNVEASVWRDDDEKYWIRQGDSLSEITSVQAGPDFRLHAARREVLWLVLRTKDGAVTLQCARPSDWLPLGKALEISVDEVHVGQLVSEGAIARRDVGLAVDWLRDEFVIDGGEPRIAIERRERTSASDWTLIGRTWRIHLESNATQKVFVRRISRSVARTASWSLVQGDIQFIDSTIASRLLSDGERDRLNQSVQSYGSYLDLWKKYGEHEWQRSLRRAAALGYLPYTAVEESSDEGGAWRFQVDPQMLEVFATAWKQLEGDEALAIEAGSRIPDWSGEHQLDLSRTENGRRFRGRPQFKSRSLLIESTSRPPPEQGFLYLSLAGDRTVQERRFKARQSIEAGRHMPQLRFILQDLPIEVGRPEKYEALTRYARECFKQGKPTQRQEDAVKVALETPDIALIIGPPGTGKTQVIAALERRLSELAESENPQHQTLISSFQHDAVENALERTDIYGLPAVKVGERRGKDGVDPVERWCDRKYQELDLIVTERESVEPHVRLLGDLYRLFATLRHAQLDANERRGRLLQADNLLRELNAGSRIRLPSLLESEWSLYISEQHGADASVPAVVASGILHKIRALRITVTGFADDGPERVLDFLLTSPDRTGAASDRLALEAFTTKSVLTSDEAAFMAALRDRLIDAVSDYRPPAVKFRLDAKGLKLIGQVEDALRDRLQQSRHGVTGVLARYRDTFVGHVRRAQDTVRQYAMVIGATCQQAASKRMASLKSISAIDESGIEFVTVIIDEAARANPLDLFIPMSMAGKRIILVGDHRQLPHILDPDLENNVATEHSLTDAQRSAYEESLFQRLWRQLEARQNKDRRPRVVMLNTQFRMHPTLGDFVSKQFYEKEGLERLQAGREPSDFLSDIKGYEGRICCWIDVPNSRGSEEKKSSPSWQRRSEAAVVAKEAKRLLLDCGPDVSIGVITFYSAQRDEIFRELSALGLAERDPDTREWRIAEAYLETGKREERFRVGTVDAFQGKEFDIVLLSTVRSNRRSIPIAEVQAEAFEEAANKKYGHLRLSNRMNVAMSRQRSLLIVVGDRAMAQGESARQAVPALAAFLELCEGKDGHVR